MEARVRRIRIPSAQRYFFAPAWLEKGLRKKDQQQGEKQVDRSMKKSLGSAEVTGVKMVNGHRYADSRNNLFQQVRKKFVGLGSSSSFILGTYPEIRNGGQEVLALHSGEGKKNSTSVLRFLCNT